MISNQNLKIFYISPSKLVIKGKDVTPSLNLQTKKIEFCRLQEKQLPEFHNVQYLDDFAFLVNMMLLNELRTKLQGKNQLIRDMYHSGGGFHSRIECESHS